MFLFFIYNNIQYKIRGLELRDLTYLIKWVGLGLGLIYIVLYIYLDMTRTQHTNTNCYCYLTLFHILIDQYSMT
jgi:hypothetical protein